MNGRSLSPRSVRKRLEQQSTRAKISSTRLAIIPTEDLKEAFCYEFKGVSADDEPYIVYVSAETGEEVNILKVITNDEGTTTI